MPDFESGHGGSNPPASANDNKMKEYKFLYVELGNTWEAWKKDDRGNDGGFVLNWAADGIGFGQLSFIKEGEKTVCHTECMSDEFVKAALNHFLNTIEMKDV